MESDVGQSVKSVQTAVIQEAVKRTDFVEGVSPSMRSVETVMREVARSQVPVLLLAEGGAGKKATARRIHELSGRWNQSLCTVFCATLEAGKLADWYGLSSAPGVGTVFLEEVAELSPEGQACLLQVLTRQNGNGSRAESLPRLVCGTARDLEAEVR